jgi:hypothetical protein
VSRLRGARTTLPPRFDSKILGRFERLSGLLSTYRPKLRAGGEVFGQLRPRTAPYPALNACLRDVGTRKKTRRRDQTRRVLTKGQDIDRPATRRGAVRIDATRSASLETERGLLAWEARSSFGLPAAGEESQKGFAAATRGVRRGRQRGIAARSIEALISEQAPGLGSPSACSLDSRIARRQPHERASIPLALPPWVSHFATVSLVAGKTWAVATRKVSDLTQKQAAAIHATASYSLYSSREAGLDASVGAAMGLRESSFASTAKTLRGNKREVLA